MHKRHPFSAVLQHQAMDVLSFETPLGDQSTCGLVQQYLFVNDGVLDVCPYL